MVDHKDMISLVKKLADIKEFEEDDNAKTEDKERANLITQALEKGYLGIVDPAHVAMLVIRRPDLIRFVGSFIDMGQLEHQPKIPTSNFEMSNEDMGQINETIYSGEYLKMLLAMATKYDHIRIKMKKDYPLSLTVPDRSIEYILAPSIEENSDIPDWMKEQTPEVENIDETIRADTEEEISSIDEEDLESDSDIFNIFYVSMKSPDGDIDYEYGIHEIDLKPGYEILVEKKISIKAENEIEARITFRKEYLPLLRD